MAFSFSNLGRNFWKFPVLSLSRSLSCARPLAIDVYGPPDAKRTAVFLHGILGNKKNWRGPCNKFVQLIPDLKCVAIDLRGHGSSQEMPGRNSVAQCALDLHETFAQYHIEPYMLCAHSFGGKVALHYLESSKLLSSPPPITWVIDSIPGKYPIEMMKSDGNSILGVFKALKGVPKRFPTRGWFVQYMTEQGISLDITMWLSTNVAPIDGEFYINMELDTIHELFEDFCKIDAWPILERHSSDEKVFYLRAGKNKLWQDEHIKKFDELHKSNENILMVDMPHVGHWVHVEDLDGMVSLMRKHSNI